MNLANNIINGNSSNVIPNVAPKSGTIYNPDIPVKSDTNNNSVRAQRQIKLKDKYYVDNLLTTQVKNNGTLSLGDATSKYSKFGDIDRTIDVNNLRRRNIENTKYTMPNDYFNGSYSAYYSVPRTTRTAVNRNSSMGVPIAPLPGMDNLNYKNQFKTPSEIPKIPEYTETNDKTIKANFDFDKWLYEHADDSNTQDSTTQDKDTDNVLTDYDLDRIYLDRNRTRYDNNYGKDKYGRPIIKATNTPILRGKKSGQFMDHAI